MRSTHRAVAALVSFAAVLAACANTPSTTAMADQNAKVARRAVEEFWIQKNFANADEFYAPDHVSYTNGVKDTISGVAFVKQTMKDYPDFKVAIEDVVATADRAVITWTFSATDPKTGKPLNITGVGIDKIVDGKITESHGYYDMLGPMIGAGATFVPPGGMPAAAAKPSK